MGKSSAAERLGLALALMLITLLFGTFYILRHLCNIHTWSLVAEKFRGTSTKRLPGPVDKMN